MRCVSGILLGLCLSVLSGCGSLKAAAYFLSPAHIQKAEFEFPKDSKVAVMLDPAQPDYVSPVFDRALYERLAEYFRENKSTAELLPPREIARLKREHADFDTWPVRRIGQELGASHVLYIRIDELQPVGGRASPILEPRVTLRQKVIGVNLPDHDARLWPKEEDKGRIVEATRHASDAADTSHADAEVAKLGREVAYLVMTPFFDVDLEQSRPREN